MVTPQKQNTLWAFPAVVLAVDGLALLAVWSLLTHDWGVNVLYSTLWQYIMLAVVSVGFITSLVRRRNVRMTWEVVGAVAVVVGAWFVTALLFPVWVAIGVSAFLTILAIFWRPFLDVFTIVGTVGMAFAFATWMPIEVLMIGLAMLVTYDMVAGSHGHSVQALIDRVGPKAFLPYFDVGSAVGSLQLAIPAAVLLSIAPYSLVGGAFIAIGGTAGALFTAIKTPRALRTEYVAIGTLSAAAIVLLFRVLL